MKVYFKKYIFLFLIMAITFIVFRSWFTSSILAGGDLEYYWNYNFFSILPFAWKTQIGLGYNFISTFWTYISMSVPINLFGK